MRILTVIGLLTCLYGMYAFHKHDTDTVHKSIGKTVHTHYSKLFTGKETCIEYYDSNRFLGTYLPVYVCEAR